MRAKVFVYTVCVPLNTMTQQSLRLASNERGCFAPRIKSASKRKWYYARRRSARRARASGCGLAGYGYVASE